MALGLLGVLHIWDAGITLFFLEKGLATELNPLLSMAYVFGPDYFLGAKAFLVIWGSVILGFAWEYVGARRAAYGLCLLYCALALYELNSLIQYFW